MPPQVDTKRKTEFLTASAGYTHPFLSDITPCRKSLHQVQVQEGATRHVLQLLLVVRVLNLLIQRCVVKVVVWIQVAERVLREQHVRRRAIKRIPVIVSLVLFGAARNTYTWKQSIINATASGPIVSWMSSGMGGVSPLAIL